jgi:hypothetical protein
MEPPNNEWKLDDNEIRAIDMARRFATAPFAFPNASLLLLVDKLSKRLGELALENQELRVQITEGWD